MFLIHTDVSPGKAITSHPSCWRHRICSLWPSWWLLLISSLSFSGNCPGGTAATSLGRDIETSAPPNPNTLKGNVAHSNKVNKRKLQATWRINYCLRAKRMMTMVMLMMATMVTCSSLFLLGLAAAHASSSAVSRSSSSSSSSPSSSSSSSPRMKLSYKGKKWWYFREIQN